MLLQWLELKIGYQDNSPSNDHQGDMQLYLGLVYLGNRHTHVHDVLYVTFQHLDKSPQLGFQLPFKTKYSTVKSLI